MKLFALIILAFIAGNSVLAPANVSTPNGGIDELKRDIIQFSNEFQVMDAYIRQAFRTELGVGWIKWDDFEKKYKGKQLHPQEGATSASEQNDSFTKYEDSPIIKEVAILVDEAKRKEKERNKDKPPSNRDYSVIEAGKKLKQLAIDNKTKIDNWINNLKNDPSNEIKVKVLRIFWKMFDLVRAKLESQIFYMGHYSKKAPSDMFHGIVNSLFHTPKYHAALNCITSWAKNQQKIDVSNVDDLLKKLEESDGEIKKIDAEINTENQEPIGSTKAE